MMEGFPHRLGAVARNGAEPEAEVEVDTTVLRSVSSRREVSRGTRIGRGVVVLALIPLGVFYLGPRIYDLTATPGRLQQSVEAADHYNPALARLVEHERVTVSAFAALDKVRQCLTDVLGMGEAVSAELGTLIGTISVDLQEILDHTGVDIDGLVGSLDTLSARVGALRAPANSAATALSDNRATMAAILDDVRVTAARVHDTRLSVESAATDLSGR
ncbi:hypothetical protein [Rhodococcus tibetensis]|uniref:Uncharacterized protein n=1 Tax=Rhodococcus tibetensis TaxID=2965064 RepID=A0ABT1Q7S8_9NOCA|nr:hypothetical protein [Rhodococcus sp. FXJ9.536]MCQ4118312.1 hypothetical protein [Rhodococcus sp. FXJ9.536]